LAGLGNLSDLCTTLQQGGESYGAMSMIWIH
jgi:hypothetical protein